MKIDVLDAARVVRFCARACQQHSYEPTSTADMFAAWAHIVTWNEGGHRLDAHAVMSLGMVTCPEKVLGFRTVPVTLPNTTVIPATRIRERVQNLMEAVYEKTITPLEFFKEFEEIHPFVDGNGRVGYLLYNFFNNSVLDPVDPPDCFNEPAKGVNLLG